MAILAAALVAHPTEIKHITAFLTIYPPFYDVHTLMKLSWSLRKTCVILVNTLQKKNILLFFIPNT
jgi:hypothetical protein